jgi:phosphoglycolate phosphatase
MTNLLFDLDGTLTDPKEGIVACIRFALLKLDIEIDKAINLESYIGPPLRDAFYELCGNEEVAENAVSLYRERFSTLGLFENRVYDGIPECLAQLAEKVDSIYVATSKPTIYSKRIIEHFKLSQYFDVVYGSNLDGSLSDKTDLLGHILKNEDLRPEDTVMIGDRSFDMVGAKNHGLKAVGVLWGFGNEKELNHAGADVLCHHPNDICAQILT